METVCARVPYPSQEAYPQDLLPRVIEKHLNEGKMVKPTVCDKEAQEKEEQCEENEEHPCNLGVLECCLTFHFGSKVVFTAFTNQHSKPPDRSLQQTVGRLVLY